MELLTHEIDMSDKVRIICPLCGCSMAGLGHAKGSGCPHLVATTLCAGSWDSLIVEDFGARQDLSDLVHDKVALRTLLEGHNEAEVTRDDLMEAWHNLAQLHPESVLLEFRVHVEFESKHGYYLSHGLFSLGDSLSRETFLQELKVDITADPPSRPSSGNPLKRTLFFALAILLWTFDSLSPSLYKKFTDLVDRWLKRRRERLQA